MYDGRVILEYNDKRHSYEVIEDGKATRVPSVTTICGIIDKSAALTQWASNMAVNVMRGGILPDTPYPEVYLETLFNVAKFGHRAVKQEAADIGTQAHRWLESYFKHGVKNDPPDHPQVCNCIHAALDWLDTHHVEPIEIEKRVYSRKHRFSGTLDKLALVDGVLSLIDWKSSKGMYPEYRLQTAAYVGAFEEECGKKVQTRYLIKLGKEDGEFEPHEYPRKFQKKDYQIFISALKLYKGLKTL